MSLGIGCGFVAAMGALVFGDVVGDFFGDAVVMPENGAEYLSDRISGRGGCLTHR